MAVVSAEHWVGFYLDQEKVIARSWNTNEDLNWVLTRLGVPFRGVELTIQPEKLNPPDEGLVVAYSADWLAVWLNGEIIWQGAEDRLRPHEVLFILKHITSYAEVNGLAPKSNLINADLPEQLPRNVNYKMVGVGYT